jgi:membrane-associated phospholipid phosphatase
MRVRVGRVHVDWTLVGIIVSCLLLAWGFALVGSGVTEEQFSSIDQSVREAVLANQSPAGVAFFRALTSLGSKAVLVVLGIVLGWIISGRSITVVVLVALCALVSAEFVDFLKEGFAVERPFEDVLGDRSLSFPSGHASGVAAIATLLCYVAWRRHTKPVLVTVVSALFVALMALSRIYLNQHWTSDVVGGVLIGVALGLGCSALYEWIDRRDHRRRAREIAAARRDGVTVSETKAAPR